MPASSRPSRQGTVPGPYHGTGQACGPKRASKHAKIENGPAETLLTVGVKEGCWVTLDEFASHLRVGLVRLRVGEDWPRQASGPSPLSPVAGVRHQRSI